MDEIKEMDLESKDLVAERVKQIKALFPEVATEGDGGIDFEKLRLILGDEVDEGDERYAFTWPGKADAIRQAQIVSTATLRPCPEESVDWDSTQNLYIEGDNLEVLKLLQRGYHGKVKMIYIDPPYNTGKDFVYKDSFEDGVAAYKEQSGSKGQSNADTSGRYHANWCSMMYPRLRLARELMARDGVIFLSIDDAEVANLRTICDEIFGVQNFVACLVYDKNRKNDAKYFSVGHEYMLVYFKDASFVSEAGIVWRAPKEGVDEVKEKFNDLKKIYGSDWDRITQEMRSWYSTWDEKDPKKPLARFSKVDEFGPFRDDGNISWPGGGGPKYDVIHPITGKPCKVPDAGWRFPRLERMQEEIEKGRVVFGPDETTLPRIRRNLFESDGQVLKSVKFSYAQTATLEFTKIFDGARVFENPKSIDDICELVSYVTTNDKDAIILDFFSGSATTAHAVFRANLNDGGERRFILVQLPQLCDESSPAYKSGFKNICEIGKERIRRAGESVKAEVEEAGIQMRIGEESAKMPDVGFRVLKLDDSGISRPESGQLLLDRIKEDRSEEDIIFEMMLKWGLELTYPILKSSIGEYEYYSIAGDALICCMSEGLTVQVIQEIADMEPDRVLILDSVLDDTLKLNALQIFKHVEEKTQKKIDLRTV